MPLKTVRLPLLVLALAACGSAGGEGGPEGRAEGAVPEVEVAANDADLAADAALANEAAADEAADMSDYGGDAAAMEANGQ